MNGRQVGRVNQQSKGETPLVSGILQRAAVCSVADKEVEATEEMESGTLRESRFQHDFSQVPIHRGGLPIIQAKLTIGAVGDRYEQEADQVAKDVVSRMNAPESPTVRREEISELEEEELQRKPIVQRVSDVGGIAASADLEGAIQGARGSGHPLVESVREPIERAFGADFSGVRVHTGAKSDELNQSIQAKAFTTGRDIFFRQGAYDPSSREGKELIAHELTHVVQQSGEKVQQQSKEYGVEELSQQGSGEKNSKYSSAAKEQKEGRKEKTKQFVMKKIQRTAKRVKRRKGLKRHLLKATQRRNASEVSAVITHNGIVVKNIEPIRNEERQRFDDPKTGHAYAREEGGKNSKKKSRDGELYLIDRIEEWLPRYLSWISTPKKQIDDVSSDPPIEPGQLTHEIKIDLIGPRGTCGDCEESLGRFLDDIQRRFGMTNDYKFVKYKIATRHVAEVQPLPVDVVDRGDDRSKRYGSQEAGLRPSSGVIKPKRGWIPRHYKHKIKPSSRRHWHGHQIFSEPRTHIIFADTERFKEERQKPETVNIQRKSKYVTIAHPTARRLSIIQRDSIELPTQEEEAILANITNFLADFRQGLNNAGVRLQAGLQAGVSILNSIQDVMTQSANPGNAGQTLHNYINTHNFNITNDQKLNRVRKKLRENIFVNVNTTFEQVPRLAAHLQPLLNAVWSIYKAYDQQTEVREQTVGEDVGLNYNVLPNPPACLAVNLGNPPTLNDINNNAGVQADTSRVKSEATSRITWHYNDGSYIAVDIPGGGNEKYQVSFLPHIHLVASDGTPMSRNGIGVPTASEPAHILLHWKTYELTQLIRQILGQNNNNFSLPEHLTQIGRFP